MSKQKTKSKTVDMLKICRNTFLLCFFVAILAFVTSKLPFSERLVNLTKSSFFGSQDSGMTSEAAGIFACDFEVYGKVQGVFFRKYTQQTAKRLKLNGWCQNTADGTVRGQLEGPKPQMEEMKKWLQETGSPKSRIDRAVFSDTTKIDKQRFKEFTIRR